MATVMTEFLSCFSAKTTLTLYRAEVLSALKTKKALVLKYTLIYKVKPEQCYDKVFMFILKKLKHVLS